MRQQILNTYASTLDQAKKLVADVPDARWAELPFEGAKSPAWVLTHLCLASGMGAGYLSEQPEEVGGMSGLPDSWVQAAMPGGEISGERSAYGDGATIIRELERVHALLVERFSASSDAALAQAFPNPDFREFFPTLGDAVFYLMAYHEGYHLGQLSAWRRVLGFGPVE